MTYVVIKITIMFWLIGMFLDWMHFWSFIIMVVNLFCRRAGSWQRSVTWHETWSRSKKLWWCKDYRIITFSDIYQQLLTLTILEPKWLAFATSTNYRCAVWSGYILSAEWLKFSSWYPLKMILNSSRNDGLFHLRNSAG